MPQSLSRVVIPLLDRLLRKHPDTPKNRAEQWILAGRVSVNGVVIRKPHQSIADPKIDPDNPVTETAGQAP